MAEPHDSLLAFLADLHDQAEAFERTAARSKIITEIIDDLKQRLVAEAIVVRQAAEKLSGG